MNLFVDCVGLIVFFSWHVKSAERHRHVNLLPPCFHNLFPLWHAKPKNEETYTGKKNTYLCIFPRLVCNLLFWGDWTGPKRHAEVNMENWPAASLYASIISFKSAVLPQKGEQYVHEMQPLSFTCRILLEGHQLFLQKVQYFLKRHNILTKHAALLWKLQYSLKQAVVSKVFSISFKVQYCRKRYSSDSKTCIL